MDNGAYSHWKAGKGEIDFHGYMNWVTKFSRHPNFDWCLIPDKIDGTEEENIALVTKWLRAAPNAKGIPVWHLHESLEWLEHLVEKFEWIALGSSGTWKTPGTSDWWLRIAETMNVICDEEGKPKCKIHGLRMLDPDIFTRLPLSSADSANAAIHGGSLSRFGIYKPPTSSQRSAVIAERIEAHNSAPVWIGVQQGALAI